MSNSTPLQPESEKELDDQLDHLMTLTLSELSVDARDYEGRKEIAKFMKAYIQANYISRTEIKKILESAYEVEVTDLEKNMRQHRPKTAIYMEDLSNSLGLGE
jgi:hypothetical protein